MSKSNWTTPPDYAEPDDEPYQPAPLVTAAIMAFAVAWSMLALYGLADILGRVYDYTAATGG